MSTMGKESHCCCTTSEKMRLSGMSEETSTEQLPGLQQKQAGDSVSGLPLIENERFEDVDDLKCRVQNLNIQNGAGSPEWEDEHSNHSACACGSEKESTLSLSSDDTLNCDDSKHDSNDALLSLTNEDENGVETEVLDLKVSNPPSHDPQSQKTRPDKGIKAGLLMSPILLTEDVTVDVGASNRLSSVLENMSLPLLYLPTTKQIVNGDKTGSVSNDPEALSLHQDSQSGSDTLPVNGLESNNQQCLSTDGPFGPSKYHTSLSAGDIDRLRPEPDRVTLNSVESFTSNSLSCDPAARLYDTSSLSSISTGTDFSVSAVSMGDEHVDSRLIMCEGDEGAFMEVNLHGRNSFETSAGTSSLDVFENGKPKKKGLSGFLSRNLFSRKSKEDSAPGWRLFGRVPPKDSGPRDSTQITSDYYAKKRANQIAAAQSKGQSSDVMSTTALILQNRPQGLPSKSPEELEKHKLEYDAMVECARKKEQRDLKMKKRKLQQQRRQEDKLVAAAAVWNKDILPNWESMKQTKKVRELWWMGLPPNVRGKVWQMAIGNDLNITQDLYEICRSRAEDRIRLIQESKDAPGSPETTTEPASNKEASVKVIKLDVSRTFPQLCIFQKGGPYHDLMHNLLGAYACYRPDVGYVQGMSFIAAILLLNMDVADAFVCFANLLNRPCQVSFFRMDEEMMGAYYKTFEDFFLENMPGLYHHFVALHVTPNLYLMEWIFLLFSKSLPLDVACRVWDIFCRDGEEFLFQTALGILRFYENILIQMDFIHVAQYLTKLPEDMNSDDLLKHVETIHMTVDKKKFAAVLAFNKEKRGENAS